MKPDRITRRGLLMAEVRRYLRAAARYRASRVEYASACAPRYLR
jgi:hypothetical protein